MNIQQTQGRHRLGTAIAVLMVALLSACSSAPAKDSSADYESAAPSVAPDDDQNLGSIYRSGYGMTLFVDRRARQVGDIITVTLEEKTDASKSSSTATGKESNISVPTVTLFGRGVTSDGVPILTTGVSSDQDFSGKGSSTQSNSLTGSITVTVSEVLRNGSLRVRGEKWVTINQGEEFIRIKGIIRPEDIGADNAIPSYKVADARITYSGKGALADANSMGWLGRLFQSVLSPF
ncbi:MAG: flagellar L-ring protein precursor FlgH [Zhongshania aliphaticivorans]|jgi:flagellar L-ring protein precursor FlgH|uniref:Flagellar L-ring protein n=1 Tax=Zhongshania aliphaticivorans TaxID=1470434 RepID=A0A127M3M9_9GAMM|nr:flagellar basal body L-ring protein FlgH [Zhongshania aliphaticivorans]AMO67864.1 flagellar basal body L-ring protein [Zhongshania aliphaticivorans]EIF44680.1 lateral flagellar L-ring protein, LfgH [gamma proteobacterium BDW918]|tara:strand:- start:1744 stop:2448 length:705 start_codon:yes stop_codon:yes gene_type:complete